MKNIFCAAVFAVLVIIIIIGTPLQADEFEYPYYLIDSYNSDSECWTGIDQYGTFPSTVKPYEYLVGAPPSVEESAVTLSTNSWVELLFHGVLYDGPGLDLFISEMDPVGEQALIFLTDGDEQEYLLAFAQIPDTQGHLPTILGFDLAGLVLPFEPRAVRIVGLNLKGNSPGFDLSFVNARIFQDNNAKATYPYPPDKAENVPIDAVLDWFPGNNSPKHNVYFGNDISCIYPGAHTINNPIQPQNENSFDPNTLEMGKTYYWRIDEVNESDSNDIVTGTAWSFTTTNRLLIDDFESYNTDDPFENNWILEDGSYISLITNPSYVHSCRNSMEVDYYYSKTRNTLVSHTFESPQDWTAAGAKTIELFFYGYKYNDTECNMYISLNDGNNEINFMYNDINDIRNEQWQLWRIDLQSMGYYSENMNQIDMTHIESISFGMEIDLNKTSSYGYGTIFFDDITLYPSRCLPGNKQEADFNGDCIVDFKDFSELAYNWLESGYKIYQVQEPNNAPIFWYKFDNNLVDSSGNANGEFKEYVLDFVPGVYGQAINFNTLESSVKVDSVYQIISEISEGITIAFWQKSEESSYKRDTLFCSEYYYEEYENKNDPAISVNLGCWNGTGIYNWDCGTNTPYDRRLSGKHRYKKEWAGQWNHWAFTKDLETGAMQVFLNGVLINSRTDSSKVISAFDSFTIGSGWYGDYDGLMDDFRLYNYALSQPEIAYVATNGTGIFDLPLMTPSDLHPDNIIDFNDLMILANHWLGNSLYPGD
ncbi:MAG: LamG domain-containing protein [Sedimentisphaerales bacterium]|nr:LamG domain-containing protein [Sedimentisphaerales bacterium]